MKLKVVNIEICILYSKIKAHYFIFLIFDSIKIFLYESSYGSAFKFGFIRTIHHPNSHQIKFHNINNLR
jgi:hypothetical protein